MSFATHYSFDPPTEFMISSQTNGLPPMFACFNFEQAETVPEGRDCVVIVGRRNHKAIVGEIADRARKAVVIVCPGDKTFRNAGRPLPENIVRVFTTNRFHADLRVVSVPLGIRYSRAQLLRFARRHRPDVPHGDRPLLYMNFSTGDHYNLPADRRRSARRQDIAGWFRGKEWVTDRSAMQAVDGQAALFRYYSELMQHRFVVSPEGYGIDCYRHWEALYLGSIPIVQRSQHMRSFADLPILFTDDYSEIDHAYLCDAYDEFSSRLFDFSRLYAPWYTQLFVDAVRKLEDPAFVLLLSDERNPLWPAKFYLSRLSRYADDLRIANLVPTSEHEQPQWQPINGARLEINSDGAIIVEVPSETDAVGALLELNTVNGVTYHAHGEMRQMAENCRPPRLQVTTPKGKVYGEASGSGGATQIDFTFTSAKNGALLQFRPGRTGLLKIRIEPWVSPIPSTS